MERPTFPYSAVLLTLIGVWLVLQIIAGDLGGRLASYA